MQVRAHVPADGVEWLLHRRGIPLPEAPDDGGTRLGVIATSSGPAAVCTHSPQS